MSAASELVALGVVNGLLPCGLVYAALSLSLAAGEPSRAMFMMMSFGLGTIPAMMTLPALLSRMSDLMRTVLMRIAAVLLLLIGLMTLLRSFMHVPETHAALSGTLSFL
ncbi:MAG: sulfite exporter TauE/SafE family protein [Mariprofundaceae bacterium]|nr:sulfite exporter TauE/SafE family protein [Mariprofundaceae bacterium]